MRGTLAALLVVLAATPALASVRRYTYQHMESRPPSTRIPQFIVVDLESELPESNVGEGDVAYAKDSDKLFKRTSAWVEIGAGGGGGAPTTAEYWTGAADATLSAEKDLSALSTGLVLNTAGTPSAYAGTSCTNQFPRSLNASGAATCATVTDADLAVNYSGVGACGANTWASTLNDAAAPTCTQPAFSNLSGAATDGQVPNTITIDLATAATVLAADPTDCATSTHFAVGVTAAGVATCEAIADADVPNTITVDLATAATALAANGANCAANNFALGVTAGGVAECAQPAFTDLSGAATDAQVPNNVTIDLSTAATALAADPDNCLVANQFAIGVTAGGVATCAQPNFNNLSGAATDAQVPNTITVDLATTATTANAGDSATAYFVAGTIEVARGGTGAAPGADDQVLVSDSTVAATWRSVPDCGESGTLNYTASTNTFSCLTDSGGGGGLTLTTVEKDLGSVARYSGTFDITGLSGLAAGRPVLVSQAAGPYTGKGDLQDEAEMDLATATGYVVDATTIRVYWTCQPHSGPLIANVKFNYVVG